MKLNYVILVFLLLVLNLTQAQSKFIFSRNISNNQIAKFDSQNLIILDFWATWCGPCVAATKQLEIFQARNKDKVFIFSITDENQTVVNKYLKNKPIELSVVLDEDKFYLNKYNVLSRPFAILLDLDGNLLWKGHPADLNQVLFDSFYLNNKNKNYINYSDLVSFEQTDLEEKNKQIEDIKFQLKQTNNFIENMIIENNSVHFSGKLATLLAKTFRVSSLDIVIQDNLNLNLDLICSINDWKRFDFIVKNIKSKFNLEISEIEEMQETTEIIIENEKLLWDKNQIVWDESSPKFIEGTDRIKGNDISLYDLANILSDLKNHRYVYLGDNNDVFDWNFNYKFDDLMIEELSSAFGIVLKNKSVIKTTYKISNN